MEYGKDLEFGITSMCGNFWPKTYNGGEMIPVLFPGIRKKHK